MTDQAVIVQEALRSLLVRDLESLDAQVAAYPDDESLWIVREGISNPAGNLVLHLAGNLRHFIGATLGGTGYMRNREAEFSTKGLTRDALSEEVRAAIEDVESTLSSLSSAALESPYPLPINDRRVRTADFLLHLAVHLTYHLGQIDYHRRLLTPNPKPVENLSIRALTEIRAR